MPCELVPNIIIFLQEQHISGDLGDDELFKAFGDDMAVEVDKDISEIFNGWDQIGYQSPNGSPRREDTGVGSPGGGVAGGMEGNLGALGGAPKGQESNEEVCQCIFT